LKPHEDERPQSVAEFKRTLAGGAQPAEVDRTLPLAMADAPTVLATPPAAGGGMTGLTGVALDREQLKRIETDLARHLGPIAPVVVRNAAKKSLTIQALCGAVAREIADEKERAAFLRKYAAGGGDKSALAAGQTQATQLREASISQKFSAELLQRAETALAQHIGAIAKVVVKRAAAKARDEAELYLLIADEIKDPVERKSFIRKAVSVSGRN
jgi:serine/threonine-protein kinase